MKRTIDEQKALKLLKIPDFRHLNKDTVVSLVSLLPQLAPEVAIKAIEQFPKLVAASLELMRDYKEILEQALSSNDESVRRYFNICESIIDSLQKELTNENLSFDEKKYIIEQIKYFHDDAKTVLFKNQKFLARYADKAAFAFLGVIIAWVAVLGVKIKNIKKNCKRSLNRKRRALVRTPLRFL